MHLELSCTRTQSPATGCPVCCQPTIQDRGFLTLVRATSQSLRLPCSWAHLAAKLLGCILYQTQERLKKGFAFFRAVPACVL